MITWIGLCAGEIWQYLDLHQGKSFLTELFKEIKASEQTILMATGWLGREGYVVIEGDLPNPLIKLKNRTASTLIARKGHVSDTTQLVTERLVLRKLSMELAHQIFEGVDDEVTRYTWFRTPKKLAETEDFIREFSEKHRLGTDLTFAVFKKDTQEFIGCCGIHSIGKLRTPELGVWIKKAVWGRKYGREMIAELVCWARKNLDFDYLAYPVARENIKSRKIPEALGISTFEEKGNETRNGRTLDIVVYKFYHKSL